MKKLRKDQSFAKLSSQDKSSVCVAGFFHRLGTEGEEEEEENG